MCGRRLRGKGKILIFIKFNNVFVTQSKLINNVEYYGFANKNLSTFN